MASSPILLGITGNIASGKSVVRQYLENTGALTIDADLLAQQTYLPGNAAYQPIINTFGKDLCDADGQINRSRLGRIVFRDPEALVHLEAIIHPQVTIEVQNILAKATTNLVVVEAIKLFESNLHLQCQQVWTVAADDQIRLERLMVTRGLSKNDALIRITSQNPQQEKIERADWVIHTDSSFAQTWKQTQQALSGLQQSFSFSPRAALNSNFASLAPENFTQVRETFTGFSARYPTDEDLFHTLGQRSIFLEYQQDELVSLSGWKIDHFLAIIQSILAPNRKTEVIHAMISAIEEVAQQHLCQALFIPAAMLSSTQAKALGYYLGEYPPVNIHPLAVQNFLRKHGFMPGEIYWKTPE